MKSTTLSVLRRYRSNLFELVEVEQKLRDAEVHDSVQSAAKFPYSKHTIPVNGIPSSDHAHSLLVQQQELKKEIEEAERIVRTLPDARLRYAARIYYLDENYERITWEDVANIIGGGVTGESLRSAIRRNLKK